MKKIVLVLIMLSITFAAFGESREKAEMTDDEFAFLTAEIEKVLMKNADRDIGSFTLKELHGLASDLSIRYQELAYIKKVRFASLMLPGAGQYMNGDALSGTLFLFGDIAITAGTLIGSYFLLPEPVRFESIDYLNDSYAVIENAWKSLSFVDILPALGVFTGGMIVNGILRIVSANHAGEQAKEKIAAQEIQFEARPFLFLGKALGIGFQYHF
jgi:hypothetical protein